MTTPILGAIAGLIGIAIAILALLFFRKPKPPGEDRGASGARRPGGSHGPIAADIPAPVRVRSTGTAVEFVDKFRGATLFPQPGACEAAQQLRGRTFEGAQIPRVPVPGCDRTQCDCQMHEVVGRRRGPRRANADRRSDVRFAEDRRTGDDRREGGEAWQRAKD